MNFNEYVDKKTGVSFYHLPVLVAFADVYVRSNRLVSWAVELREKSRVGRLLISRILYDLKEFTLLVVNQEVSFTHNSCEFWAWQGSDIIEFCDRLLTVLDEKRLRTETKRLLKNTGTRTPIEKLFEQRQELIQKLKEIKNVKLQRATENGI